MKEVRSLGTLELRSKSDGTPEAFEGYAAKFYNPTDKGTEFELWPGAVERVAPTAFNNIAKHDVRGLFNHDSNIVLGRTTAGTMTLEVDSIGLRYRIPYDPTDADHVKVATKLRKGDVSGSSFQFRTMADEWKRETRDGKTVEVRTLVDVETFDVGPVTFPAYTASTSSVRSESKDNPLWLEYQQRTEQEALQIRSEEEARSRHIEVEMKLREIRSRL